ncbi:hypothetical protein KJ603_00280 [Patescibacteria group bacterium]|nr:hypothetical protein [Patescibacteria group bacterium]
MESIGFDFFNYFSFKKTEEYIYVRPKLVVYDLETYERYELIDLKDYKPEEILISDWWI